MFAIHDHLTNYKITPEDLSNGFFDLPYNKVNFRFSLDKTMFDVSQTLFNYDKSCRIVSATINSVNTFLEKQYGDAIDDKNDDSFKRGNDDHIWATTKLLEVIMFKYDKYNPIKHLLDNDPNWQDYIRGFVYIIYLKQAKKYVFIVKGGKTDDWYGRIKNYEHVYGKENIVVVAIFYVKFTSPSEQLLLSIIADEYGSPLKFEDDDDNLGNEYYQIKNVGTDEQAIEALLLFVDEMLCRIPSDELLDSWILHDVKEDLWEIVDNDYLEQKEEAMLAMIRKLKCLKKPAKYRAEALELLKKLTSTKTREVDEGRNALFSILVERSINEFVLRCMPKVRVSKPKLPLEVL